MPRAVYVYNFSWHNIGYDFDCILYDAYQHRSLNGQTLCLNKVIVGRTFAKNAQKMSDYPAVILGSAIALYSWTLLWLHNTISSTLKTLN